MSSKLFTAIERCDLNLLADLLSSGDDPDSPQTQGPGWRPLHAAIDALEARGSIEAVILLLRHGATVDAWDTNHDATPLLMAIFRGQPEAVRILLAAGADPNVTGSEGDSPLRWAVERNEYELVRMLLRCGAGKTINSAGGPAGMTALGQASSRLNIAMIEMLLAAGADPNALDADYRTARQRLPPAEAVDARAWEAATALLRPKDA